MAVTTYQNKGGGQHKYKPEIGIDMGIKTSVTTSEGRKYKVFVEESERIKKCQRLIARREKGLQPALAVTSNIFLRIGTKPSRSDGEPAVNVMQQIVHYLLEHEHVLQDENLNDWHKGLFGRTVQHSVLGLVKAKLIKHE